MKITSLAYSRPEDDPKKKNPNRIAPAPSPLGVAALGVGGGGSSGSSGITIGTTTVTSGTAGRVLYTTAGNVVGSAPIEVNALSATYLTVTSAAATSGVTVGVGSSGANEALILASKGAASVRITTNGSSRWDVTSAGHLLANTDNTYDIGASGATRPRTGYFGTSVFAPALRIDNLYNTAFNATVIATNGSGAVTLASASGQPFQLNSGDSLVRFGGTTSSFPAIKRSGIILQIRLADDSADAGIIVSYVNTVPVTVANLPAAATAGKGARAFVTDANATVILGLGLTVVGGGANNVPVYSDGTNWLVG